MRRHPTRVALLAALAAGAVALGGLGACALGDPTGREALRRGEIRARWKVTVSEVEVLGPYRAATLTGEKGSWQLFFPAFGSCAGLIQPGAQPVYRFEGPFGVVIGEDREQRCSPVGVGGLAAWRDRQPQRRSQYLVPREQARFSAVPLDEGASSDHLLLRGRFPLALELRWPEPMDAVVVVPSTPPCRELLDRHRATMEFRAKGPEVLVLEARSGSCPILGLALPLVL